VVSDGVIKRESYFPVWLKNAIFHRDKGYCQLCFKDLTNLLVSTDVRHIDHMVPLKAHGTNDPTNLQLTCEACNTSKGAKVLSKKHLTIPFW
jgi:5-methylcytosine-specific restriction endonuclease McrA